MGGFKIYRISTILLGVTALAGFILASTVPSTKAVDTATSRASVTVPTSCSLTANVDIAHDATLLNGIYSGGQDYYPDGIGKTTVTAFCNNSAGFAIYAVGYSGDPGTYGDNTMIGSNNANHFISTGTATSGATSQWAMKINKVTDDTAFNPENLVITTGFEDYHDVPNEYTKVASFPSSTDETLGSKFTTTYAIYISTTQVADTYTGQVKYTLVHPQDAPELSILTEYNIAYLQDFAKLTPSEFATVKSRMQIGKNYLLTDIRDGNTYYIARLADDNIWLLDNLSLDLTDPTVVNRLSSDNTNASDVSLNYLKNGGGNATDRYAITGLGYSEWTSGESYSAPQVKTIYKNDTTASLISGDRAWKHGIFYNYCAATAGSYCFGDGTSSGSSTGDVVEDICPKGWRIPSGGEGSDSEYNNLDKGGYGYDSTANYRKALRLPFAGYIQSGSRSNSGTGYWWSKTRQTDAIVLILRVSSDVENTSNTNSYRMRGRTMRCILGL